MSLTRTNRVGITVFVVGMVVAVASCLAMLYGDLPKQVIGILIVVLSIVLLLMGIPVGVAMFGAALLGLYALSGMRVVTSTMEGVAYDATASWSLSVIPMFILMGMVMWKTGLTTTAFEAARRWLGWMPGGLAVATNFAGAALAASLPVGQQLLAGVIPGLILAFAFAAVIIIQATLRPSLAPRVDMSGVTWAMRMRSLLGVLPIGIVIAIVIGGLFAGIFTATEAGVFGMLAALIFGVLYQVSNRTPWPEIWHMVRDSLIGTLTGTASVFLLIVGVAVLTRAMALSQVPNFIAREVTELGLGRVELLLILIVAYLILGMFMDTLAMMLLTIPVLMKPLEAVGVDPLWFGVFLVVMAEVGLLTPPLGILTFIVHRIASDPEANLGRQISLGTVFLGVAPFALAAIVVIGLLIAFPQLVTWLPQGSSGN
jgi:TRAP-type C4-dicarboxylate transport system permease large subunit